MSALLYQDQVRLMLDVLPEVAAEDCFAMHGGTAINLFVRDMPRLSIDIDLTYLPIEDRTTTIKNIVRALRSAKARITARLPNVHVSEPAEDPSRTKLVCSRQGSQIKIEVNTTMRGSLHDPVSLTLSTKAQKTFDRFAEMHIIPLGQLYGGKICAALDRQHPRDLFDVKSMLEIHGFSDEIREGFLLCLLSADRPMHEIIRPRLLDQRDTLINHFSGMTDEPFTYSDFETTRSSLVEAVNGGLRESERQFLISFKDGNPEWDDPKLAAFQRFPAVQWKLQNIKTLKATNPAKHEAQLDALKDRLWTPGRRGK